MVDSDRSEPDPEYEISLSVDSYDENTADDCRNFYIVKKRIVSNLSHISIPNFDSTINTFRDMSRERASVPGLVGQFHFRSHMTVEGTSLRFTRNEQYKLILNLF